VTACNCPQKPLDPACPRAKSSRQSGQQRQMPDVCRYWAGAVEQRLHDYWQNVAVDDKQRRILMCTVVHQVPRSFVVLASVHEHTAVSHCVTFSSHISPPRLSWLWRPDTGWGEAQTRPVKCCVNMNYTDQAIHMPNSYIYV